MSETFTEIDYRRAGRTAWLVLGRGGREELTPATIRELHQALDRIASSGGARFLVVTGTGPAFCGGVDEDYVRRTVGEEGGFDRIVEEFLEPFVEFLARLRRVADHVIAAVNGSCSVVGLWIVRACEFALGPEPTDVLAEQVQQLIGQLSGADARTRRLDPSAARSPRPSGVR